MTATPVRPWLIFFSSASLFVLSQFYRAAVAVITPQLIADVGLDAKGLSLLSAAFFYGFAFTQIPLVIYLDRIGSRKFMTVLNLVAVAGAALFAAAGSLEALAVARLLIGIGMAGNLMGTFKLISLWFEPLRFATLSALVFSMGTVGNIFATSPLVLLAETVGWR
jgi:MFS family permease